MARSDIPTLTRDERRSGYQIVRPRRSWRDRTTDGLLSGLGLVTALTLLGAAFVVQVRLGYLPGHVITRMHLPARPGRWPSIWSTTAAAAGLIGLIGLFDRIGLGSAVAVTVRGIARTVAGTVLTVGAGIGRAAVLWPRATAAAAAVAWAVSPAAGLIWPTVGEWARSRPATELGGALILTGCITATIAYTVRELRRPVPPAAPTPPPWQVALWREKIAGTARRLPDGTLIPAGPLPGCLVSDTVAPVEGGFRLYVRGASAVQHADEIRRAIPAIAAAYGTSAENAGVTVTVPGDHSRAIITVRSAQWVADRLSRREERLMAVRDMTGPSFDPETGIITFGVVVEDGSPAEFTLFRPGQGIRHSWVPGAVGSGKSALLSNLLASGCSAGIVMPHVLDMAGGASLPEWGDLATSFEITPAGAVRRLLLIERLYDARVKWMFEHGLTEMTPSRETPIHWVIAEESPELAADNEAMRIIDRLARLGRKALICILWVSQSGDAKQVFGAAGTTMRQQLKAGNILALFLTDASVSQALGGARDGATAFDLSTVLVPKDTPGALVAWTPQHPVPVMARAWRLTPDRRRTEVRTWVDIPTGEDDVMWGRIVADAAAEAARDAEAEAAVQDAEEVPEEAKTNADKLWAVILRLRPDDRRAETVMTGELMRESSLSESSFRYAAGVLVRRGKLLDLGYKTWRRV